MDNHFIWSFIGPVTFIIMVRSLSTDLHVLRLYMACTCVCALFRWKKKENVSVQCKTVSRSLKSNWQNPPVQKHWAAFVSSVLFNRLQPIDFCLDRFSLGRPSQCALQRGSEMLLLRLFFFSGIVLIRCGFFNVALEHNIILKWYSAGRFQATGSRQPLGMRIEETAMSNNTNQKRILSRFNLLRRWLMTLTDFVCREMPVIRQAGLTQLRFKRAVICELWD